MLRSLRMDATPKSIKPSATLDAFEILWTDGLHQQLSYRALRLECPCAGCIDEHTGKKILKEEDVPEDVRPLSVEAVGRYALAIRWSDGHSTGIYSYDKIYPLGHLPDSVTNGAH